MDYDSMSVKRLLDDYNGWSAGDTQEQEDMLVEIESALRKAVIREASVGTMDNRLKVINEHPLLVKKQVEILPDDLPSGLYDLIPKETP